MSDNKLDGRHILVVEDEYFIVKELCIALRRGGATVVGPVASLQQATALAEATDQIDGAILDVNLSGELVYPLADLLGTRGVPFVFTTGYDEAALPVRFSSVVRCEKPTDPAWVLRMLSGQLTAVPP